MALREYNDVDGVTWRVWEVKPSSMSPGSSTLLPGEFTGGWLCFDCGSEKRRLSPVPRSWEQRTDKELDVLRRAAPVVKGG